MATEKRKAQLREAQVKLRAERKSKGWKRLWIPPSVLKRVQDILMELEKYKG